jgi:hypothetical protein
MKIIPIIIITLFISLISCGQIMFERAIGTIDDDGSYGVDVCFDHGYIISGYTSNFYYGGLDIYLIKTDEFGYILWTAQTGTLPDWDYGSAVLQTLDSCYISTGYWGGDPEYSSFLWKNQIDGDSIWLQTYPLTDHEEMTSSVKQTSDSGFILCGTSNNWSSSDRHIGKISLVKVDRNGIFKWRKLFGETGMSDGNYIDVTADTGYIICGMKDILGEDEDVWLIKTDTGGNLQWERNYGGTNSLEAGACVKKTSDGGYIFCGLIYDSFVPLPGDGDVYLVKTKANGDILWSKILGGTDTDFGSSVYCIDNSGYIVCGATRSFGAGDYDVYLIRTDLDGDTLWTRTFGGQYDDYGRSVMGTSDGGFVICGTTQSFGHGGEDVYLIKTDENGLLTSLNDEINRNSSIDVYPNPSNGLFTIKCLPEYEQIYIYAANGQLVYNHMICQKTDEKLDVNLSSFPEGLYYVRILTPHDFYTEKIILW